MDFENLPQDVLDLNQLISGNIPKSPIYGGLGMARDLNVEPEKQIVIPQIKYSLSKENGVVLKDTTEFAKLQSEFSYEKMEIFKLVFEEEHTRNELRKFNYFTPELGAVKIEMLQQYFDYIDRTGETPQGFRISKGVEDNADIITTTIANNDAVAFFNAVKTEYYALQERFGNSRMAIANRSVYTLICPLNFGKDFDSVGELGGVKDGELYFRENIERMGIELRMDSELTNSFILVRNDFLHYYTERAIGDWWKGVENLGSHKETERHEFSGATKWFTNKIASKNSVRKVNYTFTRNLRTEKKAEIVKDKKLD